MDTPNGLGPRLARWHGRRNAGDVDHIAVRSLRIGILSRRIRAGGALIGSIYARDRRRDQTRHTEKQRAERPKAAAAATTAAWLCGSHGPREGLRVAAAPTIAHGKRDFDVPTVVGVPRQLPLAASIARPAASHSPQRKWVAVRVGRNRAPDQRYAHRTVSIAGFVRVGARLAIATVHVKLNRIQAAAATVTDRDGHVRGAAAVGNAPLMRPAPASIASRRADWRLYSPGTAVAVGGDNLQADCGAHSVTLGPPGSVRKSAVMTGGVLTTVQAKLLSLPPRPSLAAIVTIELPAAGWRAADAASAGVDRQTGGRPTAA